MKILLAIDASDASNAAIQSVTERPWPVGTTVRVINAVAPVHPSVLEVVTEGGVDGVRADAQRAAEDLVDQAVAVLRERGLSAEPCIRTGEAAMAIVAEAKEWGADLIVVGSHGITGMKRLLLGSVAEAVVRQAPCSVEVIRSRAGE